MLTPNQLTAIDRHLRKENWLLNEELIGELTDHYVAGTEERMQRGMPFEAAIRDIHTGFGGRKGLLELEDTYQIQRHAKFTRLQWSISCSLMYGAHWYVGSILFTGLWLLNTPHLRDAMFGFYVTFSVVTNMLRILWMSYQQRRESPMKSFLDGTFVFTFVYLVTLLTLVFSHISFFGHQFTLPAVTEQLLNTLLETMCLVFTLGMITAIWRTFRTGRRTPATRTT